MSQRAKVDLGDATIYLGDCRAVLREIVAEDVYAQTCITSPPYWGLRDYEVAGQIGLEQTIDEYVATLVDVFRAVRDVLANDATLWLNMGDGYNAGTNSARNISGESKHGYWANPHGDVRRNAQGFKTKDMLGLPWRVAFALQADGWYLRSDIIWSKPNPMPESVTDRPTKAHEYIFLLAKSKHYYYDSAAIKEPATKKLSGNKARVYPADYGRPDDHLAKGIPWEGSMRNKRTVWEIPTAPYNDAHFATFPPALIEPCVLAGSFRGGLVLDPFSGAGTTGIVALRHGRRYLGIELNPDYIALTRKRMNGHDDQTRLFR